MQRMASLAAAALALVVGLFGACGGSSTPENMRSQVATGTEVQGGLTVFAASSLTDAFRALGKAFAAQNPGVNVTFNFASSSVLSTQINEGAPADVFASANDAQMQVVTDAGNASSPVTFAANFPVVVVLAKSSGVTSFNDHARPGVRLVLAGPDVPIGAYSRQILIKASQAADGPGPDFSDRVLANLRSNEANVRAVLTKVQLGEADAGIVYRTDAAIVGDEVALIEIPALYNVTASYPVAVVKESKNLGAAEAWIRFLLSPTGQAILDDFGFGPPS